MTASAVRFSVVIPAYNAARTIRETVDSVLAQSLAPTDVVIVDDGSRDDTRDRLQMFGSRVTVVPQANAGVSTARNRGVNAAQGNWVAFCDADDVWHPDKLAVLRATIEARPESEMVFHDFWTIVNGQVTTDRATHSPDTMFPLFKELPVTVPDILTVRHEVLTGVPEFASVSTWSGRGFRWLMVGNFVMPSTVAIRKSRFLEVGGFDADFRYAEDTEFFLRLSKSIPFTWIDAALAGYRREAGTLLTGNMLPTLVGATRAVVRHCAEDAAVLNGEPEWVRPALARRFCRVAYYCLSELLVAEARQYARSALTYDRTSRPAWTIFAASALPVPVLRLARSLKGAMVGQRSGS